MPRPAPDPVDVHLGAVLRRRRLEMGMSQQALAAALDVSFQQVQKYERGVNRISASMLYRAARAQALPPTTYFQGLPDEPAPPASKHEAEVQTWLASREAWVLAEAVATMPRAARAALVQFARDAGRMS